jgi:hypothetical protein
VQNRAAKSVKKSKAKRNSPEKQSVKESGKEKVRKLTARTVSGVRNAERRK